MAMFARIFLVGLMTFVMSACAAEHIPLDCSIGGKPVRFYLDTGTSCSTIFKGSADRIGIGITNIPPENNEGFPEFVIAVTSECALTFQSLSRKHALWVASEFATNDLAEPIYDGIFGWNDISTHVFELDAARDLHVGGDCPIAGSGWTRLGVDTNSTLFVLNIPSRSGFDLRVAVDTGDLGGVELSATAWRHWKESHSNQMVTVRANYMPALARTVVQEEAWATELSLGELQFTNIVVTKGSVLSRFDAVLGMAALEHLQLVVDSPHGIAYCRPSNLVAEHYNHNHLGAVFIPRNSGSDDLVAYVASPSPAQDGGVLNGDVLLAVNDLEISAHNSNRKLLHDIWQRPSGTQLTLTIRRGERIFKVYVTLRQIIPPEPLSETGRVESSH